MVMEALVVLRELASEYEVVVVENGSTDYAWDVLDELERLYGENGVDPHDRGRVRIIRFAEALDYGGALRAGFGACRYDLIFTQTVTVSTTSGNFVACMQRLSGKKLLGAVSTSLWATSSLAVIRCTGGSFPTPITTSCGSSFALRSTMSTATSGLSSVTFLTRSS